MRHSVRSRFVFLAVAAFLGGCTASYHHRKADEEMYEILRQREAMVFGEEKGWRIETDYSERHPDEIPPGEIVEGRLVEGELRLDLGEALALAVRNSREYQARREDLYLAALDYSTERHRFRPRFNAGAEAVHSTSGTGPVRRTGRVSGQVGVSQLLQTGADIGANLSVDVVRLVSGDLRRTGPSVLSIDIVQPLLRGAGRAIVAENLTQADREVIYALRSFSQFQQSFAVRIVNDYLRLLQQQDAVRNRYNSYQTLIRSRERAEALARDRLNELQVDQARQNELRARSQYIFAVEAYLNTLDQFKIVLGIPPGYELSLDDQPLRDLEEIGLVPLPYTEARALEIALAARLDLLNDIDRFEDSKRRIAVRANQFKPGLNLFGGASLNSDPDDYTRFHSSNYQTQVGLALDLPIDRRIERNQYRREVIGFERQLRNLSLAIDATRTELRDAIRRLSQAEQNYAIQQRAVELADRRLEAAQLLWQAGQAEIRDILEAEDAQLQARNELTRSLIDYHIGRYSLLRDLGILEADEYGLWIREDLATDRVDFPRPPDDRALRIDDRVITPDELFTH